MTGVYDQENPRPDDELDLDADRHDSELEDPDLVVDPDDPEDEQLPRDGTAIYE